MPTCRVSILSRPFLLHATGFKNRRSKRRGSLPLAGLVFMVQLGLTFAGLQRADAATVDLVVDIISDKPAYMSFDLEHFTVTISNNGPDTATSVALAVNHPLADVPFETSATCQAVPGLNPNGPAVCPPGSGTAPSPSFTRMGTLLKVTIPSIPSQSQVVVQFDNRSRCPARGSATGQEALCQGEPKGNYPITATVSSAETDALGSTNTASTNIFLYPPVIEYKVLITSFPATAAPGSVAEYDFEVHSTGDQPSDKLHLFATIQGMAGTMLPLTATNNPYGANGSTLPNTVLQSIDCVSTTLGTYPLASVFPNPPMPWQTCPTVTPHPEPNTDPDAIPIPMPLSPTNSPSITGFPPGNFLDNLPGIVDAPPAGGVMRFKAHVLVGDPVCVGAGDTGSRDLVFTFGVTGLPETKSGAMMGDNQAVVTTQVPGTCKLADIALTTSGTPPSFSLNGSGVGTWTHTVTVTNLSLGGGTATNVPVQFEHHQFAFTETQGPLTCVPAGGGVCPAVLTGGSSSTSGFSFATTIPSLPPLASVTFSQQVTETRTTCWWAGTSVPINLSGHADPSPAFFDPVYSPTTPPQPPDFTPGTFFGNNGQQSIVTVSGLSQCPGGGGSSPPPGITILKSGPFASAADANTGTPVIATTLPDATQVWYKVVVTNTNNSVPLLLGDVSDSNFFPTFAVNASPPSGFLHTNNTLAGWGITCVASPANQTCHELATTTVPSGYNNQLELSYDPTLHGGSAQVPLAPSATLTYIIPFTTPTHTNKCQPDQVASNFVSAAFVDALGANEIAGPSMVSQTLGTPPCTPGVLAIQKAVLPPAVAGNPGSIPPTGLITYDVTLTNMSATATLDVPHFVDTPNAPGVTISVVSISCTVVSGGAKCPPTPVVAGIKVPAVGVPTPLPDPFDIDHEWGFAGNNTFPPGSSLKFTITVQLSNPTRNFTFITNMATFSGEDDPNGWTPVSDSKFIVPPPIPELSLQKRVSPQIAPPGTLVTYTVIVTNIGAAAANNAVFTDALPAALLATNPTGYTNVTCTNVTATGGFVPSPQGTVVCPSITSNASGLSATITTFGPNTALQFTYQALMPSTPVSVDNVATITAPSVSGVLSFGAGTAQSRENVQVIAAPIAPIPTLSEWALLLLAALLVLSAIVVMRRSRQGSRHSR